MIAKVWQVRVGHVTLYLLDTELPENTEHDRDITHRLYGGDRTTRIEQEIVLGVGGVRALDAHGLKPTVWHINEGHAAFLVLERMRGLVTQGHGLRGPRSRRSPRTPCSRRTPPVAAGHDHFAEDMIRGYFEGYCRDARHARSTTSSRSAARPATREFNMTALAVRGSRFHNGVIAHPRRRVVAASAPALWPQIPAEENPVAYVTNGVHVADLPRDRVDASSSTASSASAGRQRMADPELLGRASTTFPITSSGACASH